MTEGKRSHSVLSDLLKGVLRPDDCEDDGALWAWTTIKDVAGPFVIRPDVTVEFREGDVYYKGTPDAVAENHIFDYKRGAYSPGKDYMPQIKGYALAHCTWSPDSLVIGHVLYGSDRTHKVESFTLAEARACVLASITRHQTASDPTYCAWCDWCSHAASCPAVQEATMQTALVVPDNAEVLDQVSNEKLAQFGSRLKRLAKIGDTIIYKEIERRLLDGQSVPGWCIKNRAGKRGVGDMVRAKELSGLPEEVFLDCCSVGWEALYQAYANTNGVTKAEAKRRIDSFLKPVTVTGETSFSAAQE
jgi:hypothetical protein